jgi:3-hydroxyisobutyrate dehydrogenase-like beta-hydroxyacid dehydrogenase
MLVRVGFVGLGDQGAPVAHRIAAAGFDCVVWARRQQALEPFRAGPAKVAGSLAELGESVELLETCVFDAAGTQEVLFGPDGAARTMAPGSIIAVHSTISATEVRAVAAQAARRGLRVLDAPVSGGGLKAARGELVTMIGGDADTLEECRPVFAAFANLIVHLGGVGAGQQAKLINNAMLAANTAIAADAFGIAERLGLDRDGLAEVLQNGSGRSYGVEMAAPPGALRYMANSQARSTLAKDVRLLAELLSGAAPGSPGGGAGAWPVLLPVAQELIARLDAAASAHDR